MDALLVIPFDSSMLTECIDLYQEVFSKEPWLENSDRADVERYFLNFMDCNKFVGYVVKDNDIIIAVSIGFLKPWIKGEEYYIDQFFVDYNLQGKGIGKFFLRKIKEHLIELNIHAIILATEKGFPSYDFYKKNGFSQIDDLCFLGSEF
jgi:GNAT superfamily N-acetyltransferase